MAPKIEPSEGETGEDCEVCGHLISLHSAGDSGDLRVGMEPTPPHCEGSDGCACIGGVWFKHIKIVEDALGRWIGAYRDLIFSQAPSVLYVSCRSPPCLLKLGHSGPHLSGVGQTWDE